jgi:undecaprenyl diphosphate synthase
MSERKLLPKHVGIILDGNRRWAKQHGLSAQEGHKKGFETFKTIADASLERGIAYLSVFAFSTENWNRTKDEVSFLMSFIQIVLKKYLNDLKKKNVRFIWLGSKVG